MQAMVLTVIGRDKAGLINEIATAVSECKGNWLRSSFCHLAGQFAGFVEVLLEQDMHNELIRKCHAIANLQITLTPASEHVDTRSKRIRMTVTGNDRQGIVNDITTTLKTFSVNIREMETRCESAANWGSPLFSAKLNLLCADEVEASELKSAIEALADDLIVEFE
ncbi:glycine cleavage system protein R [Glaciecola sp. 1036]|uniref:glycine cleavage system protein R n=1 Tax=Alteromonadaceae TaxID=72275 RepID=UPI003CFEBA97